MLGIIVAMSTEFTLVEASMTEKESKKIHGIDFLCGKIGDKSIVLCQSGIGKVNSAVKTVEMILNFNPKAIINTGVAGGIDATLNVMDIVVSTEVCYHDVWCGEGNVIGQIQDMPDRFVANENLLKTALAANTDVVIRQGLICSGDQFITDGEQLSQIKMNFPDGIAVDMESASIAHVCYLYNTPFLSCRILSDTPGKDEDNFNQYLDFWALAPEKAVSLLKSIITKL